MRSSAAVGVDRESAAHSADGAAMAIAATVRSAATNSIRCCSHSCEWPSASGSRTRTSAGAVALAGQGESIDAAHKMIEDARLGVVQLDELASSTAKFLAKAT